MEVAAREWASDRGDSLTTQVPGVIELAHLGGEPPVLLLLDGQEDLQEFRRQRGLEER